LESKAIALTGFIEKNKHMEKGIVQVQYGQNIFRIGSYAGMITLQRAQLQ